MEVIPNDALILVAYIPSPKDLEIARVLGWYRIPLKSAPKMIEVDYFAFFQGSSFGDDHRWRIEYLAPYQGHELTTRSELLRDEPEHPRAKEEYFKVQLGSMIKLTKPVPADRWKRLTFLYTTGSLLINAGTLNDLVLMEPDREMVWKSLRERARVGQAYQSGHKDDPFLEQDLVKWLAVLNSGWEDLDFSNY